MNISEIHETLVQAISLYENHLEHKLEIGELIAKNKIAHKWKATYKAYVIRETTCWRFVDLSKQVIALGNLNMIVGARILTRAAIETIAALCYSSNKMESVCSGTLDFFDFSRAMSSIYLGSREYPDLQPTTNVMTLLKSVEAKYPDIHKQFNHLCESAHPSWAGLTHGYSQTDQIKYITKFDNFCNDKYGLNHEEILLACCEIFEFEYNDRWISAFEALEKWIVANDEFLESRRHSAKDQ